MLKGTVLGQVPRETNLMTDICMQQIYKGVLLGTVRSYFDGANTLGFIEWCCPRSCNQKKQRIMWNMCLFQWRWISAISMLERFCVQYATQGLIGPFEIWCHIWGVVLVSFTGMLNTEQQQYLYQFVYVGSRGIGTHA